MKLLIVFPLLLLASAGAAWIGWHAGYARAQYDHGMHPQALAEFRKAHGDSFPNGHVLLARPPMYLLIDEEDEGDPTGYFFLTPFGDKTVTFDFSLRPGKGSVGTSIGTDFGHSIHMNESGREMFLSMGPVTYRDLDSDGRWDARYKIEDEGDISSYIRVEANWVPVTRLPRKVDGGLVEATSVDGQSFRFEPSIGGWQRATIK